MLRGMTAVAGWPEAFRGSRAVAAGLVTRDQLRGPGFVRLYPDTYVPASAGEPDLRLRSLAAHLYTGGVLVGHSAAELLGVRCAPPGAPAEVNVEGTGQRSRPGLLVRRAWLEPKEIDPVEGVPVTTPIRTAYDLVRRGSLVERVIAVDALANLGTFEPDRLLHYAAYGWGTRGNADVAAALSLADRRSGSPMESRLRVLLVTSGLPRPEVQWVVQDPARRTAVWLDMAYPQWKIGIEYEGEGHAAPDQVLRDIGRYTRLVDKGWLILRYTKLDVLGEPRRVVEEVSRAISRAR